MLGEAPPELKQLFVRPVQMIRLDGREYPQRDEAEAIFLRGRLRDGTSVTPTPEKGPWLIELNDKYRPFLTYCPSRYLRL